MLAIMVASFKRFSDALADGLHHLLDQVLSIDELLLSLVIMLVLLLLLVLGFGLPTSRSLLPFLCL